MKRTLLAGLLLTNLGCATMRRHPLVTGVVVGSAIGITAGILTQQKHCPVINGYHGDPNHGYCPDSWPEKK